MNDKVIVEFTEGLVAAMASSTGDYSSIHMNGEFARRTRYRERIVHGMLPVALVHMLWLGRASHSRRARLAKLTCRFVGPLHVGNRAVLSYTDDETAGQVRFEVRDASDDALVTNGSFFFVPSDDVVQGAGPAMLFAERLTEHALTPADMTPGTEETLRFEATRSCAQGWLEELPVALRAEFGNAELDENFGATLSASTLIGMRLPGRFATFTDLTAEFDANLHAGESVALRGVVASAPTSTNRTRLSLSWIRDGIELGRGHANTLVSPVNSNSVSVASIKDAASLKIEGKVALVTGASRGIGEVTAKLLAVHGAKVVVHYFKGERDAQATVADITENGGCATAIQADLRDSGEIERMFEAILSEVGGVDILINNAVAQFSPKDVLTVSARDYLDELNVSLFGMHECCRHAAAHMQAQRWGKIVNLGTVATEAPVTGQNVYITAKAAVGGYTRSLAVELAPHNIQVNMVLPRMTETSLIASLPRTLVEKLAEESIVGRLLEPMEVAKVIAFLASDWSSPISGQRVVLNQSEMPYL